MSTMQIAKIDLAAIDFTDQTYLLRPPDNGPLAETLAASLLRVGMLHPPLVQETTAHYRIVAGRKRLLAARDLLQINRCFCRIIPEELPELEVFATLLEEIQADRPLTPVEQAQFFNKIASFLEPEEAGQRFLPLMGETPHPSRIKRLLELLELEGPLLDHLHQGLLDEKTARELRKLSFRDRLALFEIIDSLGLGSGKQKKLTKVCQELAARGKSTIAELLADEELREILDNPAGNPPQKGSNLMAWLTRKQFSRLSAAEKEFKKFVNQLDLPQTAALAPSLSFEKDSVTLTATFKNREEFTKVWPTIKPHLETD